MKNGKKAEIPVAGMFELDDAGKIRVWRDYFDLATFTKQVSEPASRASPLISLCVAMPRCPSRTRGAAGRELMI
jgi:hypothetical protein